MWFDRLSNSRSLSGPVSLTGGSSGGDHSAGIAKAGERGVNCQRKRKLGSSLCGAVWTSGLATALKSFCPGQGSPSPAPPYLGPARGCRHGDTGSLEPLPARPRVSAALEPPDWTAIWTLPPAQRLLRGGGGILSSWDSCPENLCLWPF